MLDYLTRLDRRWIFLVMFLAVAIPTLVGFRFPEEPSQLVRNVFDAVEDLPRGSRIFMAYDYDPGAQGELHPMGVALTRHCALRGHRMYYMTLWPQGLPLLQANLDVLKTEFPDLKYGEHYVNFGFRGGGNEGPIKVIVTDLRKSVSSDIYGTSLDQMPITRDVKNVQQMDLIISVSAGDPGTKQWVQFAATPFGIPLVGGSTGVQSATLYPYIPNQLRGLLGAIKGAAEFEFLLNEKYPQLKENPSAFEAQRRMGTQLIAHVTLIALIVLGNVIFFAQQRREVAP
ncbi:MAG: hypothetical protein AB7I48_12720 [Planctomycetaceae bacterium]